eukprot:SAG31_NODE_39213_length_290_cov_0.769634_1_plen_54_part_01
MYHIAYIYRSRRIVLNAYGMRIIIFFKYSTMYAHAIASYRAIRDRAHRASAHHA